MNDDPKHTTADLAAELGITTKTLRRKAKALGIGLNLEGRAGFRYTDAERKQLHESMRPAAPVAPRRKRRAA